jgi:hypothetical protein
MVINRDNNLIIDSLDYLMPFIETGRVIPIVSNSFRIEEIFREDKELSAMLAEAPQHYDEVRTFDQQLTKKWAEKIEYPMSDSYNLARVAQFRQVESGFPEGARIEYIKFLIERLLKINEDDEEYKDTVARIRKRSQATLFSDVAQQLDYPRFEPGIEDPLRLLAKLPLRIYITTSYSNFLERALIAEEKTPRTQLCFCRVGKSHIRSEHLPDRDFRPTPTNPAVVHLYGLEDYTNTLILSEDDYMNFLMNAVEEINSQDYFPSYLRGALPESSLILIGYHMQDWDFRTLFRFGSRVRKAEAVDDEITPSIAIQFKPTLGRKEIEDRSLQYLEKYFAKRNFRVKWTGAEEFVYELWDTWNRYIRDH